MRMWMIPPARMCRKHLLGEHVEIHMLVGCLQRKKSVAGFVELGLIETRSIYTRHEQLVREMERRGYTHASPLPKLRIVPDLGRVKRKVSLEELARRCKECRQLIG